ncbi:MAG TPA: ADYC domain-containing protein, partial [Dehalococcoidia bacterium]|nr:ADYC domain-containing protein [Dehalococcoidia bacterium]
RIASVSEHHDILGDQATVLVAPPHWEYEVMVKTAGGEQNLCQPPATRALAVPFAWSASGELLAEPGFFTFACVPHQDNGIFRGGGAIAKCIDWGYPPWADPAASLSRPPEVTIDNSLHSYASQVAVRFHQTCVRMATADYCGEGYSNTITDTPIGIADVGNVLPPHPGTAALAQRNGGNVRLVTSPSPAQFPMTSYKPSALYKGAPAPLFLEGIWGIDGCGRARILCLSRARWDTLSLAATCTDRVMARRLSSGPTYKGRDCDFKPCDPRLPKLCEQWTAEDLAREEATLFSYSTIWDRALVTFVDQRSGRLITTSRVHHTFPPAAAGPAYGDDRDGFTFQESELPVSPVQNASFAELRYEGRAFSASMPPLLQDNLCIQSGLKPGCLRPLAQYRNLAGHYLATTQAPPNGYSPLPGAEGLIYASQPPEAEAVPLYSWKTPSGLHATSAADRLEGYDRDGNTPVGWLPLRSGLAY